MAMHDQLQPQYVRDAGNLCYVSKYVKNWRKSVRKQFGADVVKLIRESWQWLDFLEVEEYDKALSCTLQAKTIAMTITVEELARKLQKETDMDEMVFAFDVAEWRCQFAEYIPVDIQSVIKRLKKHYKMQENIEIYGIQNKTKDS